MNYIKSICNISEKTFTLSVENNKEIYIGETELQFSFQSDQEITKFTNLSFGFNLYNDTDGNVSSGRFPLIDLNIEYADKTPIQCVRFDLKNLSNYILHVWTENADSTFSADYTLNVNKPPKPFESWVWKGNEWVAPIPPPTDCDHKWNESTQTWVELARI